MFSHKLIDAMKGFLIVFLCVCLLVFGGTAWWLLHRYRRWPPAAWARAVKSRAAELRRRLHELKHPIASQRTAADRIREELFAAQKNSVSVRALERYRGIGPKIVETLQAAGIQTLTQAEAHAKAFLFKKKLENIGDAREEMLTAAVEQLLAAERTRFDTGQSAEGQKYRQRLAELSMEEQQLAEARDRERRALDRALSQYRPLEDLARRVNFAAYLRDTVPGLTQELLARPLPEVIVDPPESKPATAQSSASERPSAPARSPATVPHSTPAIQNQQASPASLGINSAWRADLAKLQAFCRFGLLVAKGDGRIAAAERGVIRNHLGDLFGSDPVLLRHLDPELEQAEKNLPTESEAINTVRALVPRSDWPGLYAFAERIADAVGGRTERERALLARLATAFDLVDEAIDAPPSPPEPSLPETHLPEPSQPKPPLPKPPSAEPSLPAIQPSAREVLGIPPGAKLTVELIRRRYNLLAEPICPEKAGRMGPEFARLAEEKLAVLRQAAEELLAPFGEPLELPHAEEQPKDLRHNPELDDLFGA